MLFKFLQMFLVLGGCEAVVLELSTKFEDIDSSSNTWATNLPSLTVKIVSNDFTLTGTGIFSVLHRDRDGNVIQDCAIDVSNSACTARSCSGVTCIRTSNMVIDYVFDNVTSATNGSVISLPQTTFAPVAPPSDWIYEPLTIYVQSCTHTSDGLENVNLVDVSAVCDFNCSSKVSCAGGYVPSKENAVCSANATWSWDGVCELETTTEAPTELASTEPLTPEEPDNGCNKTDTNNCEEGICCACLGGIVIIAISISGSISCIVVIILLGSDFVKGQIVICVVGGCSMILGIVCGAVPLRSCSNYVIWIGGDIASIALGSIGTFVTLIFLGYLIVVRCKPEYSLGKR